jgi:DNA polymerase
MDGKQGAEALEAIAAEVQVCAKCDLCQGARQGVPGSGDPHAEIMLIGEAPSYVDDRRGASFSGPSGVFLDELLTRAGLSRAEIFLTNIVKHHPPDQRELTAQEVTACAPYLTRQISAINPILIVTLGRGAAKRFFPRARITEIHGHAKLVDGRIVVAMYNPAAALHREELRQTVVDDFTNALPAAIAEARRLAAEGKLGQRDGDDGETFEQPSLF